MLLLNVGKSILAKLYLAKAVPLESLLDLERSGALFSINIGWNFDQIWINLVHGFFSIQGPPNRANGNLGSIL